MKLKERGPKRSEIRKLSIEEQAAFFVNAKRLKTAFNGLRANLANAKNVTDPTGRLSDAEKALLIASVESAGALDTAIERKQISKRHGNMLARVLNVWIERAATDTKQSV
ncbi:MAG: hypothetical protein AAB573_03185 [Patescibacteria group bacterium]